MYTLYMYCCMCCAVCLVAQSCSNLCDPMNCNLPGSSVHGGSSGKNTRVGCHALLQGIFPTQGSNPGLPHCRYILYCPSHQGSPRILEWIAYPFSRGTSQHRNQTGVLCIAGGFLTSWASRESYVVVYILINGATGGQRFHVYFISHNAMYILGIQWKYMDFLGHMKTGLFLSFCVLAQHLVQLLIYCIFFFSINRLNVQMIIQWSGRSICSVIRQIWVQIWPSTTSLVTTGGNFSTFLSCIFLYCHWG